MPFYLDRTGKEPDLSQMVDVAIKVLKQNPRGFFLMVEGARIGHVGHSNDPGGMVGDLLEFDRAAVLVIRDYTDMQTIEAVVVEIDDNLCVIKA